VCIGGVSMGHACWPRWLPLLASLGATAGCAQISELAEYTRRAPDPRMLAETYPLSEPDSRVIAETAALEGEWAKMPTTMDVAPSSTSLSTPPAPHPLLTSVARAEAKPPVGSPAGASSTEAPRRTLWDKQPWEIELDQIVRSICRAC